MIAQCIANLTESGIASFCQVHFFQEFTNPAVTVPAAEYAVLTQAFLTNGPVRTRVTDNDNSIRLYTHLYRFPYVIFLMTDGVRESFRFPSDSKTFWSKTFFIESINLFLTTFILRHIITLLYNTVIIWGASWKRNHLSHWKIFCRPPWRNFRTRVF